MLNITQLLCGSKNDNLSLVSGKRIKRISTCGNECPRPAVSWAITRAGDSVSPVDAGESTDSVKSDHARELNFTEGLMLLNDLRKFEVPAVLFTGADPLGREDAVDLMQHAVEIGLNVTLDTPGSQIDEAMAERLGKIGLDYLNFTIHGGEKRHDLLTGCNGAFRKLLTAIRLCKQNGIRVGVRFPVQQMNRMDLDAVFDLCVQHGVQRLCVQHLAYAGAINDRTRADLNHSQTREVVDRIFTRAQAEHEAGHELEVLTVGNYSDASYLLMRLEKIDPARFHEARRMLAAAGGNRSGCDIAAIDAFGNVHYDPESAHYICGNVRDRSFSDIWANPTDARLKILRDRIDALPERCQICRFVGVCNGNNRTRAEAATGDWLSPDPACYINATDLGLTLPAESFIPDLHTQRHQHTWTADAL